MSGPIPWLSMHAQLRQQAACPLYDSQHLSLPLSTSIVFVLSRELSVVCPKPSGVVPWAVVSSLPGAVAAHVPTTLSPTHLSCPLKPLTCIMRPLHLLVPLFLLTTAPQTYIQPLSIDLSEEVIRAEIQLSTAAVNTPGHPPPPPLCLFPHQSSQSPHCLLPALQVMCQYVYSSCNYQQFMFLCHLFTCLITIINSFVIDYSHMHSTWLASSWA